ncbi:MAG: hypothetical protein ACXWCY_16220 [Burkholderiales bacterium]
MTFRLHCTGALNLVGAFMLTLAICASAPAAQFSFAALGDTPYNREEEPQFVTMMAEMNHQRLAFAVHVGDFKDSLTACSDELFKQRREWFGLSHHPFFYTPGDNEWTDCGRTAWGRREPLERLAKLRELFFSQDASIGQRSMKADRQTARGYPEHMRWMVENVLFATLNVPGPDNHRKDMPEEASRRTPALLQWMREAFRIAGDRKLPALVLAMQGNLWTGNRGYSDIIAALAEEAQRYPGEVLVIHGDTHWFRFDRPLVDPRSGRHVENVTRLEVYGSPFINWIYVTANTDNGRARFSAIPGSQLSSEERR